MIRSAEDILRQAVGLIPFITMDHNEGKAIIEAIKVAQREAIEECAKKGKIIQTGNKRTSVPTGSNFNSVMAHIPVYEVDKQSILKLLNEIK